MPGHNHFSWCTCGWCVKHPTSIQGPVLATAASPWRRHANRCDSYVDPNALCPVCGAEVFFYQSPYGGRVFFDDLGPPWPKHACTDNCPSTIRILALTGAMTPRSSRLDEWKPLETSGSEQVGNKKKVIWKHPLQKVCNYSLYLPNDFAIDHPCYWRRNKNDPANIE